MSTSGDRHEHTWAGDDGVVLRIVTDDKKASITITGLDGRTTWSALAGDGARSDPERAAEEAGSVLTNWVMRMSSRRSTRRRWAR